MNTTYIVMGKLVFIISNDVTNVFVSPFIGSLHP